MLNPEGSTLSFFFLTNRIMSRENFLTLNAKLLIRNGNFLLNQNTSFGSTFPLFSALTFLFLEYYVLNTYTVYLLSEYGDYNNPYTMSLFVGLRNAKNGIGL